MMNTAMPRTDLKRELKALYNPSADEVAIVDVPPLNFVMIDGAGNPNTAAEYQEALQALYAVAYAVKFKLKKSDPALDFPVMPLEGLWWAEDMAAFDVTGNKDDWLWTMMIAMPDHVSAGLVEEAKRETARKKDLPALDKLRLGRYDEGSVAQIMHLGPYSAEGPTVARLHGFIQENGYAIRGKHHEIYLGDPRRSAPDKLRTIIRQPINRT